MVRLTLPSDEPETEERIAPVKTGKESTPLRILVAEDNPVNQMLISKLLMEVGHSLELAANGNEVMKILHEDEEPFDLVLMDIQMPEVDGIQATRLIRASDEAFRNIPVLALTAHATGDIERQCEEAGMVAFISKPINPGILYAEISAHGNASPKPEQLSESKDAAA